jgi:GNAT superfamily N-acetyltransferase
VTDNPSDLTLLSTNGRFSQPPANDTLPGPASEPEPDMPELRFRPIEPGDAPALQDAFEHLSPLSRYYRFHAGMRRLPEELLERLTHVDGVNHVALVALETRAGRETGVGVARFARYAERPDHAEVAVTVIDRAQGHGVARRLLAELAKVARERGIATFTLNVLAVNTRVRRMAQRMGGVAERGEAGVIAYQVPVRNLAA